jgi:hypothetical protein
LRATTYTAIEIPQKMLTSQSFFIRYQYIIYDNRTSPHTVMEESVEQAAVEVFIFEETNLRSTKNKRTSVLRDHSE